MSETLYRRCGAVDLHKDTVVACVLPIAGQAGRMARKTCRTFYFTVI
jgi:hypothetical protein